MKQDIRVSIITPNYNCSRFIAQTIESVLAQTYKDWEMIIVDDCSTDGSYEIALEYTKKDSRIRVYPMEHNSGAALCRNKAIELSQGQCLAFLDSDDLWMPEKLEKQLKFMQENDCDFSFTGYELIDEESRKLGIKVRVIKKLAYKKMLLHCFTGCLAVMYKQDVNNKIFGPDITKNNDYALFLEVLKHIHNARGYPECLAQYRIRQKSLSRNKIGKIKSFFYLMLHIEHKNFIVVCFYLITNQLIKIIWKYKRS
ncbi:putative teichuronic acid biosynthesis glycosyltransferase TuaG [Spirochaetia bacterium]|nr:putative teichuronic acid biosynthesis glycosyltransferase TuaG [Spirochaetia bacterium]